MQKDPRALLLLATRRRRNGLANAIPVTDSGYQG